MSEDAVTSEDWSEPAEKVAGKRLSDAQRKEICDLYAAGKMKVTALAEQFGVTKSAISQLLKKNEVIWASRLAEEASEKIERAAREAPPARDPKFAEKRMSRIEQTREESYNWMRLVQMKALKIQQEAELSGTPIATLKETIRVLRMQVAMIAESSRFRLEVLDAHEHRDEAELPQIIIRDLAEEALGEDEEDLSFDAGELVIAEDE